MESRPTSIAGVGEAGVLDAAIYEAGQRIESPRNVA